MPLVVVIQPTRPSSLARAPPLVGVVRRETSETVTAAKRPVVRSGVTRARRQSRERVVVRVIQTPSFHSPRMKLLVEPDVAALNAFLTNVNVGDYVVSGQVESYSCACAKRGEARGRASARGRTGRRDGAGRDD